MSKLPKILIICGPTATGKTSLGLKLAQQLDGEIVSADSRQVYRGLDVGTGKDVSTKFQKSNFKFQKIEIPFYQIPNTKIWGYDLAEPSEDFSVGHYARLMQPVIEEVINRGKLPIIVGGTGFYIKSLLNPPETIEIKPNQEQRAELEKLTVKQLQNRLSQLDKTKLESMNNSDRHNPRRLVRAIEVAESGPVAQIDNTHFDSLWIGLTAAKHSLKESVRQNIYKRLDQGFEAEVVSLIESNLDWSLPWSTSTGYKIWRNYLEGLTDRQMAIDLWLTQEHQYQKRQLTYFKKLSQIQWYQVDREDKESLMMELVKIWLRR